MKTKNIPHRAARTFFCLALALGAFVFCAACTGAGTGVFSPKIVCDAASGPANPKYGAVADRTLPPYEYDGNDPVEKLVYETEIKRSGQNEKGCFLIVSPQIAGTSKENGLLKVFFLSCGKEYVLWGSGKITENGGWNIPSAATYRERSGGGYDLEKYETAQDGDNLYAKSVRDFCRTPVTGKPVAGLADRLLNPDFSGLEKHSGENLQKYLKKNGITAR